MLYDTAGGGTVIRHRGDNANFACLMYTLRSASKGAVVATTAQVHSGLTLKVQDSVAPDPAKDELPPRGWLSH